MFLTLRMASHFKWYPSSEETVVPWNARYQFPSQANKSIKLTPRIPPKNGAVFTPGQVCRLEFPAQGYVNPLNTTLEFDVTLCSYTTLGTSVTRFQNNIQSIFQRVRLLYGATPLEDIINYNVVVRALGEWTGTNQTNTIDQCTVNEGVGGCIIGNASDVHLGSGTVTAGNTSGTVNVRQAYIQGIDYTGNGQTFTQTLFGANNGSGAIPNSAITVPGFTPPSGCVYTTRRYQVNFALGLFTQDKLVIFSKFDFRFLLNLWHLNWLLN